MYFVHLNLCWPNLLATTVGTFINIYIFILAVGGIWNFIIYTVSIVSNNKFYVSDSFNFNNIIINYVIPNTYSIGLD